MPGVILSSANLSGVTAHGCHLYDGPVNKAKLNQAVLFETDFSESNLTGVDLSEATLTGVNLSNTSLIGAQFHGAILQPSKGSGIGTSFESANLQGANFSEATLEGVDFLDAAIAMPSPEDQDLTYGVWLHEVSQTEDPLYSNYASELDSATEIYSLKYAENAKFIKEGKVDGHLRLRLSQQGLTLDHNSVISKLESSSVWKITDGPSVYIIINGWEAGKHDVVAYDVYLSGSTTLLFSLPLSARQFLKMGPVDASLAKVFAENHHSLSLDATVAPTNRPVAWQIIDAVNSKTYTLWYGFDTLDQPPWIERVFWLRASVPNLHTLFGAQSVPLRYQARVSKDDSVWIVDNGSTDPFNMTTGYVKFSITKDESPGHLNIYGREFHVLGLNSKQEPAYSSHICEPTIITQDSLDDACLLPNNKKKSENMEREIPFRHWMRFSEKFPDPPQCVPTSQFYCSDP